MKRAVFFDFDKTLITGDSQALEGRHIVRSKIFSAAYLARIARVLGAGFLYERGLMKPWQYNNYYLKTYKGINKSWLEKEAEILYRESIRPLYIPGMLKKLDYHRGNGDITAVITATSEHLIRPAMKDLKVDFILATRIETDHAGYCTGRAIGQICVGNEKRNAIKRMASREGISLKDSWAYSDHHADFGFLNAVGYPVAVNPTNELKKIAQNRDWQILNL